MSAQGPRIVVVGAGLAGLRAAEAAVAAGWSAEIVVVGDEPYLPYNRPPLSKEGLAVDGAGLTIEALELRRRRSLAGVSWVLGTRAVAVNLSGHDVVLADGGVLSWDGLVVATGLRARRLGLLSRPAVGRHVLRTVDDAAALREDLAAGTRVVVIGAGFVGCEVAAAAATHGCAVDVVAPELVPLARPLGACVGAAIRRRHEARGVVFHLGRVPAVIEPSRADPERVGAVVLDDGTRLPADVVVEAVGSLPNVEWLAGSGLEVSDGVLTDGWMRAVGAAGTSRHDVVAAGDVARYPNALFDGADGAHRLEHWNNATDTGRRAGSTLVAALTGGQLAPEPLAVVPSFWSDQYAEHLESFGALDLADDVRVLEGDLDGEFLAGYYRAGRLVGAVAIGHLPRLLELREHLSRRR